MFSGLKFQVILTIYFFKTAFCLVGGLVFLPVTTGGIFGTTLQV